MDFVGTLNDKMAGFYRSKYEITRNNKTESKWMATTQFEATDARKAFPCWDEPAIKATFTIRMVVTPELQVLSNMPVAKTSEEAGKKVFHFEKSPIMSTYLVAFVVGEFDFVEAKTKHDVLIRVYSPPGLSVSLSIFFGIKQPKVVAVIVIQQKKNCLSPVQTIKNLVLPKKKKGNKILGNSL